MVTPQTGSGDSGMTDLLGRRRVAKSDPIIEALGDVDEATSFVGVARAALSPLQTQTTDILEHLQRDLYEVMAELAMPTASAHACRVGPDKLAWLDTTIEAVQRDVPPPTQFVLPGATIVGAHLDAARAVVRRAERAVVRVLEVSNADPNAGYPANRLLGSYLNRLSLLLYVLARAADAVDGLAPQLARDPHQKRS